MSRAIYRVSIAKAYLLVMSCSLIAIGHSPFARADASMQINQLCSTRWPDNATARLICANSQAAAASALITRIESAVEGSPEFNVAKTCIEKFKIKPPSTIDWSSAFNCFRSRVGEPGVDGNPSAR